VIGWAAHIVGSNWIGIIFLKIVDLSMPGYIKAALQKFQHPHTLNMHHTHEIHQYMEPKPSTLRLKKTSLFYLKRMSQEFNS
jgi:hypothetical protein